MIRCLIAVICLLLRLQIVYADMAEKIASTAKTNASSLHSAGMQFQTNVTSSLLRGKPTGSVPLGNLKLGSLAVSLSEPVNSNGEWGPWFSEEGAGTGRCNGIVGGIRCSGKYCNNMGLSCDNSLQHLHTGPWQPWFSEENSRSSCPAGQWVSGLKCRGDYCDDLSLQFSAVRNAKQTNCRELPSISDESAPLHYKKGSYLRGLRCGGKYCDNVFSYVCDLKPYCKVEPSSQVKGSWIVSRTVALAGRQSYTYENTRSHEESKSEEWSKSLTVSASASFQYAGISGSIDVSHQVSSSQASSVSEALSKQEGQTQEYEIPADMVGRTMWQFAYSIVDSCLHSESLKVHQFAFTPAVPLPPCCFPGWGYDAPSYTRCYKGGMIPEMQNSDHCKEHDGEEKAGKKGDDEETGNEGETTKTTAYLYTDFGANVCMPQSLGVASAAECKSAAAALGVTYISSGSWNTLPGGCAAYKDGRLWFNGAHGKGRDEYRVVCTSAASGSVTGQHSGEDMHYSQMNYGANTCASGSSSLVSAAACKSAAAALGYTYVTSGSWDNLPGGCAAYTDGRLWFNSAHGKARDDYRLVCNSATSVSAIGYHSSEDMDYSQMNYGANTCASGSFSLASAASCKSAAAALGYTYVTSGSWDNLPGGCAAYTDGRLWFNSARGKARDDYRLVCTLATSERENGLHSSEDIDYSQMKYGANTCASGSSVLASAAACKSAAVALGFTYKAAGSWNNLPGGCSAHREGTAWFNIATGNAGKDWRVICSRRKLYRQLANNTGCSTIVRSSTGNVASIENCATLATANKHEYFDWGLDGWCNSCPADTYEIKFSGHGLYKVFSTPDYMERSVVRDEGRTVESINPMLSIDHCKRACTSNPSCNSFTVCQSNPHGCWLKDKIVSAFDPDSTDWTMQYVRQCKTWFKQMTPPAPPSLPVFDSPTATPSPTTTPLGSDSNACSSRTENCAVSLCCSDRGFVCYEKNQDWAGCRRSCEPGIWEEDQPEHQTPWSCKSVGAPAPHPRVVTLITSAAPHSDTTSPIEYRVTGSDTWQTLFSEASLKQQFEITVYGTQLQLRPTGTDGWRLASVLVDGKALFDNADYWLDEPCQSTSGYATCFSKVSPLTLHLPEDSMRASAPHPRVVEIVTSNATHSNTNSPVEYRIVGSSAWQTLFFEASLDQHFQIIVHGTQLQLRPTGDDGWRLAKVVVDGKVLLDKVDYWLDEPCQSTSGYATCFSKSSPLTLNLPDAGRRLLIV